MDSDNLKRAWKYGLRLLVMLAVNSEFLCKVAELSNECPDDPMIIQRQILAANGLQAEIDAESGGSGKGWYRIVYTPDEARRAILDGKLAAVLGVETQNAFGGCRTVPTGTVPAVLFTVAPGTEIAWKVDCGASDSKSELIRTQRALGWFEHYWRLGARHFFPIHTMDNLVGGTALSIPILHANDNPSRKENGTVPFFDRVPDIDRVLRTARPPIQSFDCSSKFDFDGGRCNTLGLTKTGRQLIKFMASNGAILDIDHMSWKVKRELLSSEGLLGGVYPFVSSHGGMAEINHGDFSNEGQLAIEDISQMISSGGAFGPILRQVAHKSQQSTYPAGTTIRPHRCGGTSESFIQAYRYITTQLNTLEF